MAQWLRRQHMDQKVLGSNPDSTLLCSCHSVGLNNHIRAHEVYFHCLPPRLSGETLNRGPVPLRLSDEMLNRGPGSIVSMVPVHQTKPFPFSPSMKALGYQAAFVHHPVIESKNSWCRLHKQAWRCNGLRLCLRHPHPQPPRRRLRLLPHRLLGNT